jgi:hypothetical protein
VICAFSWCALDEGLRRRLESSMAAKTCGCAPGKMIALIGAAETVDASVV